MLTGIIAGAIGKIADIVDQFVEDKDKALELKTQIEKELLSLRSQLLQAQAQIITAETKSESWITRSWRPITMLTFTALLVADWLGFTAPNLTPEMKAKLYDIIQLGLGGYVIGRSFEKITKEIKEPIKELVKRKRPMLHEEDYF